MPGDIGAVATLINTVASWLMDENGYAEFSKRRALKRLHKEALHALERGDLVEYRRLSDELVRLSNAA
jgi:hypothetical protein